MGTTRNRAVVALIAFLLSAATWSPAGASTTDGADVAVGLTASAARAPLVPGAWYRITVTNVGTTTVSAVSVALRVDSRHATTWPTPPCTFDDATDTFTCSFGTLAPGATAMTDPFTYFALPPQVRLDLDATATLSASTPADVAPGNDSATARCHYQGRTIGVPLLYPELSC